MYHLLPCPLVVPNEMAGTPKKRFLELLAILTKRGSIELPDTILESELSFAGRSNVLAWFETQLNGQVQLLDPAPFLMVADHIKLMSEGRIIYFDSNHLTDFGAEQVSELFREVFN